MRIALYGIGGLYNYGCEAIVRGTIELIRRVSPDSKIIYFSVRANEDREKISDLNIEIIQIKTGFSFFARAMNRVFRVMNIPYRMGDKANKQIITAADAIFSIGGDIYTIPEHVRKNQEYAYYKKLVQFGEYALKKQKKLIIYGASIGPFGDYVKAQKYYFNHLKKATLIVARERQCISYLSQNNIQDNVCFMPDPAFAVTLKTEEKIIPKYIGINLSPLSLREIYGTVSEEMIIKLTRQIENIVFATNLEVLLIPHVISPLNEADNDLLFMERVCYYLDANIKEKVKLCRPNSFLCAKKILRTCRVVIAARMHCAINAVSEGIPTLFLSYSEKAKGMSQFVYGDDRFLLQLKDINSEISDKVIHMLNEENETRRYLEDKIVQIRKLMFQDRSVERILGIINDDGK